MIEHLECRRFLSVVAFFNNGQYVDNTSESPHAEATNVRLQLERDGHTVKPFTSVAKADLQSVLASADLVVFPEMENGNLWDTLTNAEREDFAGVIKAYVAGGGGFMNVGNYYNRELTNGLFGYTMFDQGVFVSGDYRLITAEAAGTAFAGGPATLGVRGFTANSDLPAGTKRIYGRGAGGDDGSAPAVLLIPYTKGQIAWLGYDFDEGGPNGTFDSGWNETLRRAVLQVAKKSTTPQPVTLQAESAVLSAGTTKGTQHSGYTGTGYADFGGDGSAATFTLNWSAAGNATLAFRYANGATTARPFAVFVNGISIGTLAGTPTGAWTTWGTVSITTALKSGTNTIKVVAGKATGANLDALTASSSGTTPPTTAFVTLSAGTLTVRGTTAADMLYVGVTGSQTFARLGDQRLYFATSSISKINVFADAGNDRVTIAAGVIGTSLSGDAGNDTLVGGQFNDTLSGGDGNDLLIGNAGTDQFDGGNNDDWFFALDGIKETLTGGSGSDFAQVDGVDVLSLIEDLA